MHNCRIERKTIMLRYPFSILLLSSIILSFSVVSCWKTDSLKPGTPKQETIKPETPTPEISAPEAAKPFIQKEIPGVIRLQGSPDEIGKQHGERLKTEIQTMIKNYIIGKTDWISTKDERIARVRTMKPSLPDWYLRELSACAIAADVDEDVLLYAQCEGDIRSLGGCTTFVAYGNSTDNGQAEIGRNFDYFGFESVETCATIFTIIPNDGYAFISVGWSGILGGWTFFNEKGLFVANNLNYSNKKNPIGVPTLILERIIAQTAGTLDEAIAIIKNNPRMRGQALIIGEIRYHTDGMIRNAAVVKYDAENVSVEPCGNGFSFHTSVGSRRTEILEILKNPSRNPEDTIKSAGGILTLHSVVIRPESDKLWVAHGVTSNAHQSRYRKFSISELLKR